VPHLAQMLRTALRAVRRQAPLLPTSLPPPPHHLPHLHQQSQRFHLAAHEAFPASAGPDADAGAGSGGGGEVEIGDRCVKTATLNPKP